tara:strand:+ start:10900 stop:11679 length:780 start_codon:yes stop_codon:yes gene_type:complete
MGGALPEPSLFEPQQYSPSSLKEAALFWQSRTVSEHRSISVFTLLAAQLIEANATLDAKTVMLRMAQDEVRHTELCAQFLAQLTGQESMEMDVHVEPLATHQGVSAFERALRNVIYTTCLSETVASARLIHGLESTHDAYARAITRLIIRDEVMHGRFGFLYLEACAETLRDDPQMAASLATYCQYAFAVLEAELAPASMRHGASPSQEARNLGVLAPDEAYEVFHQTIAHVIIPGLEERGVAAADAWRQRDANVVHSP